MFRGIASIRLKVMLIVLATSLASLLFAGVVLVAYDVRTHRQSWAGDLVIQADIIARTSAPAIVFDDTLTAHQSLAALAFRPEVQAAAVYTKAGRLFASYAKAGEFAAFPGSQGADGYQFARNGLTLFRPILDPDGRVGTVYLRARYDLMDRLSNYLPVLALIGIGSLLVAIALSYALQSSVTKPVLAIAGVARDVRARRDYSLRVAKETTDETGQLVDAFNAMLAEVSQAQGALLDSNRRKDDFLATLAHELRNPLGPIRNAAYAMRMQGADPAHAHSLELIDRQVQHMARLIEDLLDISRISRDALELRYTEFSVRDLIRDVLEGTQYAAEEADQTLRVEAEDPELRLYADRARIVQVVGNLVHNAVKYTPRGGHIELLVSSRGTELLIAVKDDGIGIPADKLEDIFEPFSQLDRSLEKTRGGLGIGLALSQRLVELHEGTLTATSEGPGRGSTFLVSLPIVSATPAPAPPAVPVAASVDGRYSILVADDSADGAESLARLLQVMGHRTTVAHDGEEAFAKLEKGEFDAAVLDIGMPRLNGYDLARRIREQSWGRSMYLVALTGWGHAADKLRAQAAGFDRHLTKPVEAEQLMAALNARRSGAQEPSGGGSLTAERSF